MSKIEEIRHREVTEGRIILETHAKLILQMTIDVLGSDLHYDRAKAIAAAKLSASKLIDEQLSWVTTREYE